MSFRLLRAAERFRETLVRCGIDPIGPPHRGAVRLSLDECTDGLAYLTLDHRYMLFILERFPSTTLSFPREVSKKRNAMTGPMMLDLANCVHRLSMWKEGRALILSGAGGHFCAGADFSLATALASSEDGLSMVRWAT